MGWKKELVALLGSRARPDAKWVSRVADVEVTQIDSVLSEISEQMALERAIHRVLKSTGRTYYAQFPAPLELYAITRLVRPNHIIETGVSSGMSSAHFLMALRRNGNGTLHSIDLPQHQKDKKRGKGELSWSIPPTRNSGWAVPSRLKQGWDLRLGRSEDLLESLLDAIGTVDIFCHDSPWTPDHLAFEFESISSRLKSGSVVVADNTDSNPKAVEKLARVTSAKVFRRKNSSLVGIRVP